MIKCINCQSIDVGKIGVRQYYCWNCCIEMTIDGDKMDVFQVEKDGSVSSLNDLFIEGAEFVEQTEETASVSSGSIQHSSVKSSSSASSMKNSSSTSANLASASGE